MTRALFHAALTLTLAACIDTDLSLGHHDAPQVGDGDGDSAPQDMDAYVPPVIMTGGMDAITGGAPAMPEPDSGPPEPDANVAVPPASPCSESVAMTATLSCEVEEGSFGGQPGGSPPPMTTTTTLTFEPLQRMGRDGFAHASGMLSFEAWQATFTGRIDGDLDCTRGAFFGLIFEGEMAMPGAPIRPFFGQLEALSDPDSGALTGTWWHGPDPSTPVCIGTWTAAAP